MKKLQTVILDLLPMETIDNYFENDDTMFGDILLKAMGYEATCTFLARCKRGNRNGWYNIGWMLENGDEYANTFSPEEIKRALKGKTLTLYAEVKYDP